MPRTIRTLATAVFVLLTATSAFAQQRPPARSVIDDYEKGKKAIDQKRWDDAIAALTAAVTKDAQDRVYVEGVNRDRYFPHHYLFIAYTEKGDLAKARENYALRGALLPQDFVAQETPYVARLNGGPGPAPGGTGVPAGGTGAAVNDRAMAAYRNGLAALRASRWPEAATQFSNAIGIDPAPKPDPAPDGYFPQYYLAIANLRQNKLDEAEAAFGRRGTIKVAYLADEEAKFPKELEFARNVAAGDEAFGKQQLAAAAASWKKACDSLPDECNSRGITQKMNDANATVARNAVANEVAQHVLSAKSAIGDNDLEGAKREFQAAVQRDPNNAEAVAGLKDIQTREQTYTASKARAEQAVKANDYVTASKEFETARNAHPRWFRDRDKLDAVLGTVMGRRMETENIDKVANEAQAAFKEGRYATAKQDAEAVLARSPNYANLDLKSIIVRSESRIAYEDGRKMAATGEYFQADTKYKEALQKDPNNDVASKALGISAQYQSFVGQKLFPQARNVDRARFESERPDLHFDEVDAIKGANEAFANLEYGSAKKKVDEVLAQNPTNSAALGLRRRLVAVTSAARRADADTASGVVRTPVPQPQNEPPLLPMWMWGAIAVVAFVGVGSIVVVRGRAPMPVAIDALPWAHVSIQPVGRSTKLAREGTTPFSIDLPKGEYDLKVTSESSSEPYNLRINVVPGQTNKVLVTMPAYDVDDILSGLLS